MSGELLEVNFDLKSQTTDYQIINLKTQHSKLITHQSTIVLEV